MYVCANVSLRVSVCLCVCACVFVTEGEGKWRVWAGTLSPESA